MSDFCSKCGSELEPNNNFCTKCGSSTISNVSKKEDYESILKTDKPKKTGRSKKKKLGIGFGITILIFFVIIMAVPSSPNSSSNNFESNYYEMGETIHLKGIDIQVLRTTTSGTDFWNTPDGTFFHVYVKVENVGKTTDTFTPLQFVLVDGEGREFNHLYFFTNSEDAIWTSEEIQPNLPITQFVTFDVPYASDLKYELKVKNAGFVCLRNC